MMRECEQCLLHRFQHGPISGYKIINKTGTAFGGADSAERSDIFYENG